MFVREMCFFACCSVCYTKGLGCDDALLTISHHLQKSLDTMMESYFIQLGVRAAFDTVSRSGLLFKLKFTGIGGSVLSNYREFLSNHRQRVVVDGVTSLRIPNVPGVKQGSVLGTLLFIGEQITHRTDTDYMPNADNSTLLTVVRKPADLLTTLLLPPTTGTWLLFGSGAITGP